MSDPMETIQELRARLAQCEANSQRSAKVQAALYKVAEAASSAADLQEFYKSLHEIIAELMYAGNFFIATLDQDSGMLSWPYHIDEKDVVEEELDSRTLPRRQDCDLVCSAYRPESSCSNAVPGADSSRRDRNHRDIIRGCGIRSAES